MPTLVHTADVHLREGDDRRLEALSAVLELARDREADLVTIGGDLFDGPEDAEALRPTLRNDYFTDGPPVVVIPGNHDGDAFEGDVFFGETCTVLTAEPFDEWVDPTGQLRVVGIPFRERPDDDLLLALRDREPFDGTDVLLLHCSLDAPVGDAETGDEDAGREYFPIGSDTLADLEFDYHLAGHYHSQHRLSLPDDSVFTYPGTPASTRRSETGQRHVAVLDTDDGLGFEQLETFRYERFRQTVRPGDGEAVLERLETWVDSRLDGDVRSEVVVDGHLEMDEATFAERLSALTEEVDQVRDETRSVSHVLSHGLFEDFETALAEREWDEETQEAVRAWAIDAFAAVDSGGGL